ncbi:hypothetical protein CN373_21345 [Bacillus cereus]|nr:hypothetical protein CN373_21345 [Bacillus cereus]
MIYLFYRRKVSLYRQLSLFLYLLLSFKILLKKLLHFNKRTGIFIFVVTKDNKEKRTKNNF